MRASGSGHRVDDRLSPFDHFDCVAPDPAALSPPFGASTFRRQHRRSALCADRMSAGYAAPQYKI